MNQSLFAIALVPVLAIAMCAPKPPSTNAATGAPREALAAADPSVTGVGPCHEPDTDYFTAAGAPYPDWARAEFPPYPNGRLSRCFEFIYQFRTDDDPATVLAWYKAHTAATWSGDASVPPNWVGSGKGVQVFIAAPPTATERANGIKTVIEVEPLERFDRAPGSARPTRSHAS